MAYCNCGEEIKSEDIFCYECNKKYLRSSKHIIIGLFIMIAGIVLTVTSFLSAKEFNGRYYIFYGAIVIGLFEFFKGISDYVHFKKIIKNPFKYEIKSDINDGNINEDALKRYMSYKRDNIH